MKQAIKNSSVNNLNCIQSLHHDEIKYQGEAIPILFTTDAHGLKPKGEFSSFMPYRLVMLSRRSEFTLNTYRTAVSPTLDLLCHEDFNVGRSEAESNIEIFMAQ